MSRLLLVTDDPDLANEVSAGLMAAGHLVRHAAASPLALRHLQNEKIEVVILDLKLTHSAHICEQLARAKKKTTRVLMLAARGEEVDRIVGLELGADDCLFKPFDMHTLLARVATLVKKGATPDPEFSDNGSSASLIPALPPSQRGREGGST